MGQFIEKYGSFQLKNLSELHVLRAFIAETLRNGHIIWAIPRRIYDDVTIDGYSIPKHSVVSSNYGYMDHDDKYWKVPKNFDVGNWLDADGKFKHNECSSVFGHGIRSC